VSTPGPQAGAAPGLTMTHECPAPVCTEQIDPDMLMCPRHWYQVPKPLRRAVRIAWRRGAGAGSPAHTAAMRAAIKAVRRAACPFPSSTRPAASPWKARRGPGSSPRKNPEVLHDEHV
jgi:hypothetical protein